MSGISGKAEILFEKKTEIAKITFTEKDGSETIINVTEDLHFIFGFVKAKPPENEEQHMKQIPMEIMVKGVKPVVGEIFFQMGENYPELLNYCVMRSAGRQATKIIEKMKEQGIDLAEEILKSVKPPGGGTVH